MRDKLWRPEGPPQAESLPHNFRENPRSREEIFERIRRSTAAAGAGRAAEYAAIPRLYKQAGTLARGEVLALFVDRLEDYGCGVYRCREAGIAARVRAVLMERGKQRMAAPEGLPRSWLGERLETADGADGVITGCLVAIAVTGTIVLAHAPGEGSRALTLIPDYHLCVVLEEQVVETVAEGMGRASAAAGVPITTIAGPSATADIEMTRVKGVHGPRTLDVLLAANNNQA